MLHTVRVQLYAYVFEAMLALSIPILICVILIVVSGIVQAWLLLRCSWQLPRPIGKLTTGGRVLFLGATDMVLSVCLSVGGSLWSLVRPLKWSEVLKLDINLVRTWTVASTIADIKLALEGGGVRVT